MNMKIANIDSIDFNTVYKVLTSGRITDGQKVQFLKNNSSQIHKIVELKISSSDFNYMMSKRPLVKFRPIKNSYTKRGDKSLLAKSLNIETSDVDDYIKNLTLQIDSAKGILNLSPDNIEKVKTYVYRHGKKDQVVKFLDYELSNAKNILQTLYKTLEYNTGGVADYFIRPIHRMDNKTLLGLYNVVDKNLKNCKQNGLINDAQNRETAEWALYQIYKIQNNSKFINAVKTYRELK